MTTSPLFTVVMPTYNRAELAIRASRSVLSQTCGDFEFIVVDDFSTDDTATKLAALKDPRLRVVTNVRKKGIAGARNTGIELASGTWVCQIDSDDEWQSNMLEELARAIANAPPDVGIVYCSLAFVDAKTDEVIRTRRAEKAGYVQAAFLEEHFIHHCSAALRTNLLLSIDGYDEQFLCRSDSDLLLRLTARCSVLPVPDLVYRYRVGDAGQVTNNLPVFLQSYEMYMQKHAGLFADHPRARYRQLSNRLYLSVIAREWRSASRIWAQLSSSIIRAPDLFLLSNRALAQALVESAKEQLLSIHLVAQVHARRRR